MRQKLASMLIAANIYYRLSVVGNLTQNNFILLAKAIDPSH